MDRLTETETYETINEFTKNLEDGQWPTDYYTMDWPTKQLTGGRTYYKIKKNILLDECLLFWLSADCAKWTSAFVENFEFFILFCFGCSSLFWKLTYPLCRTDYWINMNVATHAHCTSQFESVVRFRFRPLTLKAVHLSTCVYVSMLRNGSGTFGWHIGKMNVQYSDLLGPQKLWCHTN